MRGVSVLLKAGGHSQDINGRRLFVAQRGFDSCWRVGRRYVRGDGMCESQNPTGAVDDAWTGLSCTSSQASATGTVQEQASGAPRFPLLSW